MACCFMLRAFLVLGVACLLGAGGMTKADEARHKPLYYDFPVLSATALGPITPADRVHLATLIAKPCLLSSADAASEIERHREIAAALEKHFGPDYWLVATERAYLASSERLAKLDEAAQESTSAACAAQLAARQLEKSGDKAKALAGFKQAEKLFRQTLDKHDILVLEAKLLLGSRLANAKENADAAQMLSEAIVGCEAALGPKHPYLALGLSSLAVVETNRAEHRMSLAHLARSQSILADQQLQGSHAYRYDQMHRASALIKIKNYDEGYAAAISAIALMKVHVKDQSAANDLRTCQTLAATCLLWQGKPKSAAVFVEPLTTDEQLAKAPNNARVVLLIYAECLRQQGEIEKHAEVTERIAQLKPR